MLGTAGMSGARLNTWPCGHGIFRMPEQCGSGDGQPPEKIPPSQGPASRLPMSETVDYQGLHLSYCRAVRGTSMVDLEPRWMENVREGYEWLRKGVSWGGNTAAVGGKHM